MIGIYKITNPNGLVYIGQSIDIENRWKSYFNLNCKDQSAIYNSLLKYGVESHKFEVLELCEKDDLFYREVYFIEFFNSYKKGLNASKPYKSRCLDKSIKIKSNIFTISNNYELKWQFKDNQNYVVTKCKQVINVKRGKIVKKTIKDGCKGWWIAGDFVKESKVNDLVELIKKIDCPF